MSKRVIFTVVSILSAGVLALCGLNLYKLDLVEAVVENAVAQKAPETYPRVNIKLSFIEARRSAEATHREDEYLERLLQTSQRLEKVQRLTERDLDRLLAELNPARAGS